MTRTQIIATCLVNSSMCSDMRQGEHIVASVFRSKFPKENYAAWNRPVPDSAANGIIKAVGRAMWIKVDRFIDDLRDY